MLLVLAHAGLCIAIHQREIHLVLILTWLVEMTPYGAVILIHYLQQRLVQAIDTYSRIALL